jgi:hypothetical protein
MRVNSDNEDDSDDNLPKDIKMSARRQGNMSSFLESNKRNNTKALVTSLFLAVVKFFGENPI